MRLPETMDFPIQGGLDFALPEMLRVRQRFQSGRLADVAGETLKTLNTLPLAGSLAGKRIAVGAGSRMVSNLPEILRLTVGWLRGQGAEPFIVPAMGSHAGADADGQTAMLAELGVTEESVGAPVRSSMDVVVLGTLADGSPVYCDRIAAESDGIVVCQRVKVHTSISAELESGLCKGLAVGFGKHAGARAFHMHGYDQLGRIIEETARVFVESGKLLFGLGILENAFEETMLVEAIPPENLIAREKQLLALCKENMPRLQFDQIDVLLIERMGKDINGCGCDPNITGRPIAPLPPKNSLRIQNLVVLDLTPASHGNACGIGIVDFITKRMLAQINFIDTYTNVITSGATMAARLPIILDNDEQAVRVAVRSAYRERPEDVRIVRIADTLHLNEIEVSACMRDDVRDPERFELLGPGRPIAFDGEHRLRCAENGR